MKILKQGMLHAALAMGYIVLVVSILSLTQSVGQHIPVMFLPMLVLSLLVVSAGTMASLVFGKPIMMYIDGKKREAVLLVFSTIGSLAAFASIFAIILVLHYR